MLPPLIFAPLYRRYLWGGRRFATSLGRQLPDGEDFAESWELVDHGDDQSVVSAGPHAGMTLGALAQDHGADLLGRQAPQPGFPLLFKFLDANRDLSVQVHPDDARAARLARPDRGKTEAWYVVDAEPGAKIYAGLAPGVDLPILAEALRRGRCDEVLHAFEARRGDCVFIPAGTVHAIGAGVLVAEIQQASDVTYRLHDWGRVGADGRPRALHIEAGLEAVTRFGPVEPVRQPAPAPRAAPRGDSGSPQGTRRLVTSEYFVFDEVAADGTWSCGGDDTCHFLAILGGRWSCESECGFGPLDRGRCVLLPASAGRRTFLTQSDDASPARALHVALP